MKYLFLVALAAVVLSCNNSDDAHHEDHEMEHTNASHDDHTSAGDDAVKHQLTLDNGQKWQSDATTNEGVAKMRAAVEGFNTENASVEAYHQLGKTLQDHFAELVSKCTMKGPAHDQLHVFLEQLQPKIKALQTAGAAAEAEEMLHETEALLKEYSNYFS